MSQPVLIILRACSNTLQISHIIAHQRLPEKLLILLTNPRIQKVGRMVNSDLQQLQAAIGSPIPFVGGLELSTYAKECQVWSC